MNTTSEPENGQTTSPEGDTPQAAEKPRKPPGWLKALFGWLLGLFKRKST